MGKKQKRHQIFIKFFLTNICILLIPLLISIFAYNMALNILSNDAYHMNLSKLEQSKNMLDKRWDEINSMTSLLVIKTNKWIL